MNVIYQLSILILLAVFSRGSSHEQLHIIDADEKFEDQRFLIQNDINLYLYTRAPLRSFYYYEYAQSVCIGAQESVEYISDWRSQVTYVAQLTEHYEVTSDLHGVQRVKRNQINPDKIIKGDSATLWASHFDQKKPVKIVVHGWTESGSSEINKEIKNAFLEVSDVNVIVVDWGKAAAGLYPVAALNVPAVGEYLAKVLDWLVDEGVPTERVHLIGHSMGAHVVGIAGRSLTKGRVTYMTGLDPAFNLWGTGSNRIRATDANYVEIIHTDGGALGIGIAEPIGHNDFYPNGGSHQPGCSILDLGCAHKRSWKYFADSLDHTGFRAIQCTDYNEMSKGRCANLSSMHMGGSQPKPGVGIFYLETNKNKPYFQG